VKATHTDYKHPRHLRVDTGDKRVGVDGILCVSPSCSDYARLNKSGLPKWKGKP
jgi:hypothetical protein